MINGWISRRFTNLHIFLACCGILVCLAGVFGGFPLLSKGGRIGLFWLTMIHLFHYQLYRFYQYLQDYKKQDRIPVRQIKQVNGLLLAGFLISYVGAVFVGLLLPWKPIGDFLGNVLRVVLRWLFFLLFHPGESVMEEAVSEETSVLPPNLPFSETSPTARFLEQILCILVSLTLLYWLVRLLKKGVGKLLRYLGSLRFDEDERIFLEPEIAQVKIKRGKKGWLWKKRPLMFDQTASGRIRQMYVSCVKKKLKKAKNPALAARLSYMTPAQIGEALELEEELYQIYEKARYSQEGLNV